MQDVSYSYAPGNSHQSSDKKKVRICLALSFIMLVVMCMHEALLLLTVAAV